MMRRHTGMVLAAVLLVVTLPMAGFAETWSGSKTLADGEVVTDAVTLDGSVTVEVASGTATISGVVSGGRLVKTGAGELKLSGANTMEGVTVSAGAVTAASNGALGAGTAIVLGQREGYEGLCELRFNSGSKDVSLTIPNAIEVSGNTTRSYPGFVFYYQKTILNGAITAAQDLIFYEDYPSAAIIDSNRSRLYRNCLSATFANTITAGGIVGSGGWVRYQFKGKVSAAELTSGINRPKFSTDGYSMDWNAHLAFVVTQPCEVKRVSCGLASYNYLACENAMSNAVLNENSYQTGSFGSGTEPYYYFSNYSKDTGYDQSVAGLETPVRVDTFTKPTLHCNAPKAMTLTITGLEPEEGQETRVLSSSIVMDGALSIVVDAPSVFTQTFANKNHTMTGALTVKGGTMKLTGTARFTAVTGLTVENGGIFDASATTAQDFLPTNGTLALSLKTGAVFRVPAGCTELKVKTLTIDGFSLPAKAVVTSSFSSILPEGVTFIVTTGAIPQPSTSSATWTGAGDKVMTTMVNWDGEPESLDLVSGGLAATLGAGGSMIYPNGVRINSISAAGLPVATPVVLEPQGNDDVLTIDRNVTGFSSTAQLFLRGYVATPFHFDQGTASESGSCVLQYAAKSYAADDVLPEGDDIFLRTGSSNQKSLPLVLDGVKLEKPLYAKAGRTGTYSVYARNNTTNLLSGHVSFPAPLAYIGAGAGAVIEYANGVNSGWAHRYTGSGTHIFRNKPLVCSDLCTFEGDTTVVFDTESCSTSGRADDEGMQFNACKVEFLRSGTFKDDATLVIGNNGVVTWDCNVTTQKFGIAHFVNSKAGSELRGDYPARLEVTGGIRAGASVTPTQVINIPVEGGLGFHVCGDAAALVLQARDYGSCGDLEASAGSLELAPGATWLNGTNFIARGTGMLKFASKGQVNKEKAKLVVSDGGTVCVADGSTLKFAAATVDGAPVPTGCYAAGDGTPLGSCLTSGAVQVGKPGLMLIFR